KVSVTNHCVRQIIRFAARILTSAFFYLAMSMERYARIPPSGPSISVLVFLVALLLPARCRSDSAGPKWPLVFGNISGALPPDDPKEWLRTVKPQRKFP